MIENKIPLMEIAIYYYHFTIYFANSLFPIFVFVHYLVYSKLANNTEIIVTFRFRDFIYTLLRPYIIGALFGFVLLMGFYVVPASSEGFNNFRYTHLRSGERADAWRQYRRV
jgi:lipopolysaccharide export system permease protein